jgi:AcrR family transcriptional regulator
MADPTGPDPADTATDRAVERAVLSARQRARAEIGSILDAAWSVLARTGWEDLKIGMVLEQAQVSTRNFYRNFSGKSELLVALFEEEVNRFAAQLTAAMKESDDPAEQVTTWIGLNLKRAYSPRSHARTKLFAAEGPALAPEFPEDVHRIRRLLLDPLTEAIDLGVQRGVFETPSPEAAGVAIWLITSSLMREPLAGGHLTSTHDDALGFVRDNSFRMLGVKQHETGLDPLS